MKRKEVILLIAAILCMLLLFGCGDNQQAVNVDVEIGDEYYIATVRNIISNFSDYYGKTVRIEGVFFEHGVDTIHRMVMRQDFSC